jgi:hypothetical protein
MKDFDVILEKEIKEVDNAYHKYEFGELRTLMTIQMGHNPETATEEEKIKAEPYEKDIKIIMGRMKELDEYGKHLKSAIIMRENILKQIK